MPLVCSLGCSLGPTNTGLAITYTLLDVNGATQGTGAATETPIPGDYNVDGGIAVPTGYAGGRVVWGVAGQTPLAQDWINPHMFQPAVTVDASGHVNLSPSGLDAVQVETGLNARQLLSLKAAALLGCLSGAGTARITIMGAGVSLPRIVANVDDQGNRTVISLAPPA